MHEDLEDGFSDSTLPTHQKSCRYYGTKSPKWSYIHNVGEDPLKYMSIGTLLEQTAHKFPDVDAVISKQQNVKLTYTELLTQADKLAAGMLRLGFERGNRVGLWAPNCLEWIVVQMATARAGLILVPLNPFYEASEIEYCINKVGIKALICPEVVKDMEYYNILSSIGKNLGDNGKSSNNIPSLKCIITISEKTLRGTYNYNEVLNMADEQLVSSVRKNQHLIQADDITSIQFSSGTTGKPKATKATHFNIINNAYFVGKRCELGEMHHTACIQVPLFHALGFAIVEIALITFGSTAVIPSTLYSPNANLKAIQDNNCSMIFGTPTMYVDLVNEQKKHNLSINPQIAVTGGAPCSPVLFQQMKDVLKIKKVKSVYGLTEVLIVFHSLPIDEDEYKATETVGYIGEHIEAKVTDANGNLVPVGTPGELHLRGYSTMLGYWQDDEKTQETIGYGGWLRTGDQFVLQEDGYGKIVGRIKDVIIRGGENIFPKEVEDFLNTHPDVIESQVIGLPHERLGEEVCACVRIKGNSQLTLDSMKLYCKGKLAKFKIPTVLKIVEHFPTTRSGKIQKYKLKEMFSK